MLTLVKAQLKAGWLAIGLLFAMVFFSLQATAELQAIPALTSPVTDTTQTLSSQEQAALANKLTQFSQQKGSQIAVLIVSTTQPEGIEQFSIRVAEAWKIGREKEDDGVIVVVAKNDRKIRIEVGYGLEGAIPDLYAKRIISEQVSPNFKQGDFYAGLNAATDQLIKLIEGEKLPAPSKSAQSDNMLAGMSFENVLLLTAIATLVGVSIFKPVLGRFLGAATTSGLVGSAAGLLSGLWPLGVMIALGSFVFGLFMSSAGINSGRSGGGYYGGGSSSGGSGWGSSGGSSWGGGGGDFGGGGASGDW
jgi:uncharacterized protein